MMFTSKINNNNFELTLSQNTTPGDKVEYSMEIRKNKYVWYVSAAPIQSFFRGACKTPKAVLNVFKYAAQIDGYLDFNEKTMELRLKSDFYEEDSVVILFKKETLDSANLLSDALLQLEEYKNQILQFQKIVDDFNREREPMVIYRMDFKKFHFSRYENGIWQEEKEIGKVFFYKLMDRFRGACESIMDSELQYMYDSEKFAEFEARAIQKSSNLNSQKIGFSYDGISKLFQENNFYILNVECEYHTQNIFISSVVFRKRNPWDCPAWILDRSHSHGIRIIGMYPEQSSNGYIWKPLFLRL